MFIFDSYAITQLLNVFNFVDPPEAVLYKSVPLLLTVIIIY